MRSVEVGPLRVVSKKDAYDVWGPQELRFRGMAYASFSIPGVLSTVPGCFLDDVDRRETDQESWEDQTRRPRCGVGEDGVPEPGDQGDVGPGGGVG